MIRCFSLILFFLVFFQSSAQDTIKVKSINYPKRAALLSTFVPGAGQIYNATRSHKNNVYWKLPLIYASLAGASHLLFQQQNKINEIEKEYELRENKSVGFSKYSAYDNYNLVQLHQSANTKRNLYGILLVGLYLFQIADASVEAHFMNYDISPNLALKIEPKFSDNMLAINIKLKFR
jgi:hypothetical protein